MRNVNGPLAFEKQAPKLKETKNARRIKESFVRRNALPLDASINYYTSEEFLLYKLNNCG